MEKFNSEGRGVQISSTPVPLLTFKWNSLYVRRRERYQAVSGADKAKLVERFAAFIILYTSDHYLRVGDQTMFMSPLPRCVHALCT